LPKVVCQPGSTRWGSLQLCPRSSSWVRGKGWRREEGNEEVEEERKGRKEGQGKERASPQSNPVYGPVLGSA